MTDTEEDADAIFANLRTKFVRTEDRSVAARAVREAKPMARRKRSKSDRTEQLNLKFRPGFKKLLQALAAQHDTTMTDIIERGVDGHWSRGGSAE